MATQICVEEMNLLSDLKSEKEKFESNLKEKIPGCLIIGEEEERVASTTLLSCPGVHGQGIQIELESQNIFVTTSSACSDNEPRTSRVLRAMGIDDTIGRSVVRISLCPKQIKQYKELEESNFKSSD
jgi:cysteine desulfurase